MSNEKSALLTMPSEVTGTGEPLVLVPGGLTGWLSWVPIAERLAATRTVVRVQLLSVQWGLDDEPLPDDYSPHTEMLALANTLESLGLMAPVDFAAWSYGAAVTLDLALAHPKWVRTLTLIEPPAFWVLPSLDEDAQHQREEALQLSRDHITDDDLEWFVQSAGLVPPGANPREMPQWQMMSRHRQSLRGVPSGWEYKPERGRLSELTAPVLLVKGTGSQPLLHQIVDELATRLPHAEVAEWPGAHAAHLVSTEPFLERMTTFQKEAVTARA